MKTKNPITESDLNTLYSLLEKEAYNAEYHNYHFKEANQVIRKWFKSIADELLAEDKDWKSKPIFPSDAKRVPKQEPDKEETIAMRDGKIKHNK